MASTEFAKDSAQAVQIWSKQLTRETLSKMFFKRFVGTSQNSIIRFHRDLVRGPGELIKHDLRIDDRSPGREGDAQLRGFETALTFYQDSLYINQLRKAHEFRGMSQQRTVHDLRAEARDSLSSWWARMFDSTMFAYLAGTAGLVANNPECMLNYFPGGSFAGNSLRAPDSDHVYDPSATQTLAVIDVAVEIAKTVNPRVEPVNIEGQNYYVYVMHPYSVTNLRTSLSTTAVSWTTIQQHAGPRGSKNPIFTGALGVYNGVILYESEFIPRDAATPYTHNLLLGANAGSFALGNAWGAGTSSPGMFKWTEDMWDYDNIKGVGSSAIFGIQANQWNSDRHGCVVVQTDDAANS